MKNNKLIHFALALVSLEDSSLRFLSQSVYDADMIINISDSNEIGTPEEYLLIFQTIAIYVDNQG